MNQSNDEGERCERGDGQRHLALKSKEQRGKEKANDERLLVSGKDNRKGISGEISTRLI